MSDLPDPVELTRRLLAFDTVNPPGSEGPCAAYLGGLLEQAGFAVRTVDLDRGRPNLIATLSGTDDGPPLCLSGHLDTVPLGNAPWRFDPFAGGREGDRLYGRGASDMKGGIAAMTVAAIRLAGLSEGRPNLSLVFTAGEEHGCQGAAVLAGIDGGLGPAGALVVGEPTGNYPMLGHKGALWLDAHASGVSAHGSMPDQGDNAIYKAARAALLLEGFDFGVPPHPILGPPTLNLGTISGGTTVNMVPDRASLGIDVRTIPGVTTDEIQDRLRESLGPDLEWGRAVGADSVWTEPGDPWVRDLFETMAPLLGERPEPRGVTYFTDAAILSPALGRPPTVILGPGEPSQAHKTDEYCLVSRIEAAAEAYFRIGRRWGER